MPELPEVETVRRSLLPHLVGREVLHVDADRVRLREGIDPERWPAAVEGRRLESLDRRGKYLLAVFGPHVALFHLGMSGRLLLSAPGFAVPRHTHLRLLFDHGLELRFVDPRRFGVAVVVPREELSRHPGLASLGPDVLTDDFGPCLRKQASRSRVAIRNLLLDQTVVAGLGNIYANEALARAGIRPLRAASRVSASRLATLEMAIRDVVAEALAAGGTTLDDEGFSDAAGSSGYFAIQLRVYGRQGQPCPRCGSTIVRRTATARSVFYCPRCQR
ncbi:MAG: bifunctional DNA-formamidopyrimidine glycosylase/DNA-(apurinic or apyrimidinic site) lyase [Acidobacteriota bacterium]